MRTKHRVRVHVCISGVRSPALKEIMQGPGDWRVDRDDLSAEHRGHSALTFVPNNAKTTGFLDTEKQIGRLDCLGMSGNACYRSSFLCRYLWRVNNAVCDISNGCAFADLFSMLTLDVSQATVFGIHKDKSVIINGHLVSRPTTIDGRVFILSVIKLTEMATVRVTLDA